MKKLLFVFLFSIIYLLSATSYSPASAQKPSSEFVAPRQEYYKGEVVKVIKSGTRDIQNYKNFFQFVDVKIIEGKEKGKTVSLENSGSIKTAQQKSLKTGDKVVVLKVTNQGNVAYSIWDKYRLNYIYFIIIGFFAIILIFSGIKGLGSILGMILSFTVLLGFIVPQILNGRDPLLISVIGSIVIMFTTIFLAHGVNKKTASAVLSTFISLTITGILGFLFVKGFHLTGLGDENNVFLQIGNLKINSQGLLLGGIIIGALGVLDDVTTAQSAAIFELHKLDKKLSITDLFSKGYVIGREHIASVVNTLILAYAGASLGLFVMFVFNPTNTPVWVMLNTDMIAEEIVRAVAGSTGLILAVPITTVIASYIAKNYESRSKN